MKLEDLQKIPNAVWPTPGLGLVLDPNGLIPVIVLAPNPANAYVLTYDSTTKQAKWALVPISSLVGYPSDSTKVLLGDGTWAQVANAQVAAGAAIAKSKLANLDVVNADVNASAAIAQSKIAFDAWQSYTPALTASTTNPTLGSGSTQQGQFCQIGKTVVGQGRIKFGVAGMTAGTGTYQISAPVTGVVPSPLELPVGVGWVYDSSATTMTMVIIEIDAGSGTRFVVRPHNGAGQLATDALPWVWAASDQLSFQFTYQAV